jgi:hypothetical protein
MPEPHGHDIGYCSKCRAKVVVLNGNAANHWLMDKPYPNPQCIGSGQQANEVVLWKDTTTKSKTGKR